MNRKQTAFTWDASAPSGIAAALRAIAPYEPALRGGKNAVKLYFRQTGDPEHCSAEKRPDGSVVISYGKMNMALRMVGNVVSAVLPKQAEYCPFNMFGIMLDCSRNSVMTLERRKAYFARLALFGYNMVMLYTEDTYQLKDYPFFGFMRGALDERDIRETDDFCALLGMEMIPCIQTLGHLSAALRWSAEYGDVADTGDILLADSPDTYKFIESMLLAWKGRIRSKRIHVGMDESFQIGRGRYFNLHGAVNHKELFLKHLEKVIELCRKHGFEPMAWSDMFYRLASKSGGYYDPECAVTDEVLRQVPRGIELVYWDYYSVKKDFYLKMIESHRKLAGDPLMGSGVWTWNKFWYDREITERTVGPCLQACREARVKEVFFTLWGDDGGFCDYDSSYGGLAFASELAFTGAVSNQLLNKKFNVLFHGASYDDCVDASEIELTDYVTGLDGPERVLWDDPVMMMLIGGHKFFDGDWLAVHLARFEKVARRLEGVPLDGWAGDIRSIRNLAVALAAKLRLGDAVLDAYFSTGDRRAEMTAALPLVDDYAKKLKAFIRTFLAMWRRNNSPFGLETMQIRLAGQEARVKELKLRLRDFADGKAVSIPEFDELKRIGKPAPLANYLQISHASVII